MSGPAKRAAGRVVPHVATRFQRVAAWFLHALVLGVAATCRISVRDPGGILPMIRGRPVIFAVWHNRLAFSMIVYRRLFRSGLGGRRMAALVSASRDGAFLAAILESFSVVPVRGSTSRRGPQALVEMKSLAEAGHHLAITPDGPRGPRYRAQIGMLGLARITGFPIVPVSVNCAWRWDAPSWDRFQVPLPFARCEISLGEPMEVDVSSDDVALEQGRALIESRLKGLTRD